MGKCFSTGKRRGSAEPQPVEAHHASVDTSSRATMPPNPRVQDLRQTSFKDVENFTYNEMKLASRDFREMLGEGGFGIVYKGVIDGIRPGYRSTEVAIKELGRNKLQGEREWLTEVSYLGKHRHPNIVKLIGYCCESGHRLVVYEYMAFGSLDKHLFDAPRSMPLPIRMKIALGAAKALAFLHGKEPPIIYRDFKTSNILLDSNYNPKLSDFGLARDGPTGNQSHVSTRVMGTEGYAAPEYLQTGKLTVRCDVYGFGVVLLEMLTGRRALDPNRRREERSLVVWARPQLKDTNLLVGILDPRMDGRPNLDAVSKLAMTAYCCVRELPTYRPTMNEVVQVLEELQAEAQDDSKKPPRPLSRGIIISEVPKSPANKLGDGADRQPKPRKEEGKRGSENVPRSRRTKPASEMAGSVGNPPLTDLIREDYFG